MKYVMAFAPGSGLKARTLVGATRSVLGDEARDAGLAFVSGVSVGWDKLDLALWLTGAYARATRHTPRGERFVACGPDEIAERTIEELLVRTRVQVLASLERAALTGSSLDFVEDVAWRGLVRKVTDLEGEDAWVAVDAPRARLRDRVCSLFAAHALNAPREYAALYVCHRCEAVVFDLEAKRANRCAEHSDHPMEGGPMAGPATRSHTRSS